MKPDIHPEYHLIKVVMTGGTEFFARFTYGKADETLHLVIDPTPSGLDQNRAAFGRSRRPPVALQLPLRRPRRNTKLKRLHAGAVPNNVALTSPQRAIGGATPNCFTDRTLAQALMRHYKPRTFASTV